MKDKDFIVHFERHFKGRNDISTEEIHAFFRKNEPEIPTTTLSWRIYHLKQKGILTRVGRAMYATGKVLKGYFLPVPSIKVKKIYHEIKKALPYLEVCIWDTKLLNSFMIHQMSRSFIVVETEKEGMESVFNLLAETHKNTFLNPDRKIVELYTSNFKESIIVKLLVSEAPTIEVSGINTISIEKLLVDCLAEKNLLSSQQEELDTIFNTAAEKYNISEKSLKRYAGRRGQLIEVEKLFNKYFKVSAKNKKNANS